MSDKNWYCIYTSGLGSRACLMVQSLLDRMEVEAMLWVPTQRFTITKHNKQVQNDKPLFPSYIFLNANLVDSRVEQALMEAKIGRFLHAPGEDLLPTKISQEDIEHLKSLEEINVEPVEEEIVAVEVGNLVEVCVGPFMGIKGIIVSVKEHMATIETIVFGRSAPVSVNIAHLSKLTENNSNDGK
jgi:transcription antitermination factor NusG